MTTIIKNLKNKIRGLLPETKENIIGRYSNYLLLGMSKHNAYIGLVREGISIKDIENIFEKNEIEFAEVYQTYQDEYLKEWETL